MASTFDVTVVIPSIPPRTRLLRRAVYSALNQTHPPMGISIALDKYKEGAGPTRQRALDSVTTPWVAFLDDDDEFLPLHLERLIQHAEETGCDYAYSWFKVVRPDGVIIENDPVFPPGHYLNPWNDANPRQTTVTTLVRTELAKQVRFIPPEGEDTIDGQRWGEDWQFTLGCLAAGAKISHLVEKTWLWHHDSGNTSGRPDRW
jgi:glycosyltransferase involved in cell wall biosynthesis